MAVKYDKLKGLAKEIPFKFKPQVIRYGKATMVAYIDSRDVKDIFDEEVGPENWSIDYKMIGDQMFATIGVHVESENGTTQWIYKSDGGTESNTEQEKGLISDCAKRAAVCWGVGRFLYRKGIFELKAVTDTKGKERPATDDGNILWTNDQITDYIREYKMGKKTTKPQKSTDVVKKKESTGERYEKPTSAPTYSTPQWSAALIDKVKILEKDGKKGKECLKEFLPSYNKIAGTNYKVISELNTDAELEKLISYIEELPPAGM